MFTQLNYQQWCADNKINELFGIELANYGQVEQKTTKPIYQSVDSTNTVPMPPELDDLTRLHFLTRSRKVLNVLEFGVGKSTVVFAAAIKQNQADYTDYVKNNLRRSTPFMVDSLDSSADWIETCKKNFVPELLPYVNFHSSTVDMTTFNGRACTMYSQLPNICPDLIYIDAPDQFNIRGDVRGISTASADRLPMAADVLVLEPFLLPGTLIVVDGRTANARFLKNNFQRNWTYTHFAAEDTHVFELVERPLGKLNDRQIRFCLGGNWPGLSAAA
jgi:hypothetical protein